MHVLLHCLSSKSTSWEQFPKVIACALVGLSTDQSFNFSRMILDGMLTHIVNESPFLMYPRFLQVFLNKQLDGVPKPPNFLPAVTLPSKVFTFMAKRSAKFSGRNTSLTAHILEVAQAVGAAEQESNSSGEGSSREGTASKSTASQPVPSQDSQVTEPALSPPHHAAAPSPQPDPSTHSSHHTARKETNDSPQASA